VVALTLCGGYRSLPPQDRLSEFRTRFEREPDPVNKAKLMPNLSAAEFQQIEKSVSAGDNTAALNGLEKFRDEARSCAKELDAKGIDAESHPAGFKQLQVSVRQSIRRLEGVLVSIPGDEQKPFAEVRRDLEQLDHHLMHELFPRQPGTQPAKPRK
jgi:hypothetical protein